MPSPGLSLVGFLDDPDMAIGLLVNACIPSTTDMGAIVGQWQSAKAELGAPITDAGFPDIQPFPATEAAYEAELRANPQFAMWPGAILAIVEMDPLLALQLTIDTDRSAHHATPLSNPPQLSELIKVCLPIRPTSEQINVYAGQNSLLLKARSLNVRQFSGFWDAQIMGIRFGVSTPWVQVVRFGGKCYLTNGYHRSSCIRQAGATHIPCVLRDVPDYSAIGMFPPAFFSQELLSSANPPTLGHYTQGRAIPISLRKHSRMIHVSWAEHAIPDDDTLADDHKGSNLTSPSIV
jgi:hypothetical protein